MSMSAVPVARASMTWAAIAFPTSPSPIWKTELTILGAAAPFTNATF
jgi:hypothetical protein